MTFCKSCFTPMVGVMSFSQERKERYYRCPKCKKETKHQKINDADLHFGEILRREIHKRK